MAYGIAVGTAKYGSAIAPWKIVFLVTGLLTICMGIIFLFVVPDNQMNARWLSKEDRLLAIERIRVNQQGVGNKHWKFYQLKEALLDPLTWAFFFYALVADIPNGMTSTCSASSLDVPGIGTCSIGRVLEPTVIERSHCQTSCEQWRIPPDTACSRSYSWQVSCEANQEQVLLQTSFPCSSGPSVTRLSSRCCTELPEAPLKLWL